MAIVFIEQRSRKTAWMLLQSPFVLHVRTLRRINSILPRRPGNRCFFICFNYTHVTVCVYHAELNGYLLYLLT